MPIPEGAQFEEEASPEVAIWDVSRLLPTRSPGLAPGRQYAKRRVEDIDHVVLHKSGSDGAAGFAGIRNCARYASTTNRIAFIGFPYTFWLSRVPDRDSSGRLVVYRGQPDDARSWHTGGDMNRTGIALGCQGGYDGNWDLTAQGLPRIAREPTADQWAMIKAMVEHLLAKHRIDPGNRGHDRGFGLTGHWEHGKPVCPGDAMRIWTHQRRGDAPRLLAPPQLPPTATVEIDVYRMPIRDIQRALALLGFDMSHSRKADGSFDGVWGHGSRASLEDFEASVRLPVDGTYDPATAAALLAALRARGLAALSVFRAHPV